MNEDVWPLILLGGGLLAFLLVVSFLSKNYSLNNFKSKTVGDGQHGTARWATPKEIHTTYHVVPFRPRRWRKGEDLPTVQGIILGSMGGRKHRAKKGMISQATHKLLERLRRPTAGKKEQRKPKKKKTAISKIKNVVEDQQDVRALVDSDDIHCLMIGASGVGKTAYFLYANLEYASACGMSYLKPYHMTARELAKTMILDVLHTTGITATAGVGTNLYLCKVAMDNMAKHVAPDENGVRIAELDEMSYRRQLWAHRPLTDFWRVGRGYAKKLEAIGIYTMGDIAKCSIGKPNEYYNEELLYQMFGINAELLIDHAWGWEPCRMQDIKAYRPETNSICSGQVLQCPYSFEKARLVVREMAEAVALDLLEKKLVTDQLTLTVGYDIENTAGGSYHGEIVTDRYGRKIPKHAHGTANLPRKTPSARSIMDAVLSIYDEKVNPKLSVRRITITANKIVSEDDVPQEAGMPVQFNLFDDIAAQEQQHKDEEIRLERERKIQEAMLGIKKKFGKNAILNGGSYLDGATARERNGQIGGHKA